MRKDRALLLSAILFFVCITLLYLYLLTVRFYSPLPIAVFWFSVVVAISVIVFQIFATSRPENEKLILLEVLLFGCSLNLIYQIPLYGLYETDSLRAMMTVRHIINDGSIPLGGTGAEGTISGYQLLNMWGAELHYLTGIGTFAIAKWFPSIFFHSVLVFTLYIFVKKIFTDQRVALLTILVLPTLAAATHYGTKFHYETFAVIAMITMLYFMTLARERNQTRCSILAILCLTVVIFAQHLTAFMLAVFLLIQTGIAYFLDLRARRQSDNNLSRPRIPISTAFAFLAVVGVFSYWLYVFQGPLATMVQWGAALLTVGVGEPTMAQVGFGDPQTIISLRGKVIFWGFWLFHIIFLLILLYEIIFGRKGKVVEFYSFVSLLLVCGIFALVQVYLIPAYRALAQFRIYFWGWILGLAPLVVAIVGLRSAWIRNAGILLLVSFMISNIYQVDPGVLDPEEPGRETGNITLMEDYALAKTFTFTGKGTAGHKTRVAIYDVTGFYWQQSASIRVDQLEALDWIVIKKKELEETYARMSVYESRGHPIDMETVSRLEELVAGQSSERNRIYESKNLVVFR